MIPFVLYSILIHRKWAIEDKFWILFGFSRCVGEKRVRGQSYMIWLQWFSKVESVILLRILDVGRNVDKLVLIQTCITL